jgi:7-carboxy-7-deazaguanine synthase
VALETQGSRWQEWFIEVDDLTLSPKPPSSNMKTDWAILDEIVNKCSNPNKRTSLKVVVFDDMDLQYAAKVHERYPEIPMYLQVGNQDVKGNSRDNLLPLLLQRYEWLIDCVMQSNQFKQVRVLPQLHTWLWGNKRGV